MTATAFHAADLRRDLSQRAYAYAERHGLPYFLSLGLAPTVVFTRDGERHGNFHPASFANILVHDAWARRLTKHPTQRTALPIERRGAFELDSSNSSDALLMNVLCYPGVLGSGVRALLAIDRDAELRFGHRARVPFHSRADNTELDLLAGDLIVEAKLTEGDFGARPIEKLDRYRDLHAVFDVAALPVNHRGLIAGYQLVRNVLAAHHLGMRFRLVCDERRPDLCEHLYRVLRAVRDSDLRARCGAITWQEIARLSPDPLRAFLDEKYGIV